MLPLRWHLRISLAALGLMLIVPFVNPHHYNPIPSFYQELSAVLLSLPALTLLLRREVIARIEVPEIAALPLGIGALVLLQWVYGKVVFPSQALLFLLYLLWAVFMLVVGRSLRRTLGLTRLVTPLAYALLCGTTLAAVLLAAQLFGDPLTTGMVFQRAGGIGNLGQPNHLANYLWLGLASAIYLHAQGRIGKALLAACLLLLLSAASLTGSRSVVLYAAGYALLSVWAAKHYQQPALKRTAYLALLLLPLTLALQAGFALIDTTATLGVATSGERLFQQVSGASQRLQLWRTGLAIFARHPVLGAGVGQFPWESFVLVGEHADSNDLWCAEHAHNLFIHLAAEFGGVAPLLALVFGWRWWIGFVRQPWTPAHWWIAAVLLIEAVHGQLEYPLWYAFFLGIATLALGAGSTTAIRLEVGRMARPLVAAMLLLAAVTLANLGNDYGKLEHVLNRSAQERADTIRWVSTLDTLGKLHRESLLSPYVELVYAYGLDINHDALADKIVVSERAIRFSPGARVTYNLAFLLALDGRTDDALLALQRAARAHPAELAKIVAPAKALARTYPELGPLIAGLERLSR